MTGAALLPPGVRKEIRALLPVWLGCLAAIGAAAILQRFGGVSARIASAGPIFAYALGSVALGALSIGHEYTARTLTLLLSLPADRRRLYAVKLGVLFPMVLTLAALALGLVFTPRAFDPDFVRRTTIPLLAVMCALFLAPWLTMICRSPLAGVVFAIAIPGLIHIAGDLTGVAIYGVGPDAQRLTLAVLRWGLTGVCAVAAVSSWRMFMRLEAVEGRDPQVRLPRWLRGSREAAAGSEVAAAARHPLWMLVKKEFRLQQLTLVVSGIYLLEWGTMAVVQQMAPGFVGIPFAVLTVFHSAVAALLSGSLASAEERHFGTLESEVLLPLATWKQWSVKAAMSLGLAVLLGAALPALLQAITPGAELVRVNAWFVGRIVLLAAASLYVSSLCASGLRAVMTSASAIVVVCLVVPFTYDFVRPLVVWSVDSLLTATQHVAIRWWTEPLLVATGGSFLPLVLWFGLVNHRSAERGLGRVYRQAACLAAWLAVAGVLLVL